ncbi:hypothetical protein HNQ80_003313 [Anaerosolibacter carboniphilus]|uniref:Uncharacterized protein n=1 Tax=Anaerosolibacter carboniphilus TaxID=1417629 RepID=A0A841KU08_9FIRM|nr:hypothetical protein [Anaerosolibacter carboniphilus]
MEGSTIVWMIIMLGAIVGPFVYFASLAASKEKSKTTD